MSDMTPNEMRAYIQEAPLPGEGTPPYERTEHVARETLRDLLGHAQEDSDGSLFFPRGPASVLRSLAREPLPATEPAQPEEER